MILRRDKGFPGQKALHIPETVIRKQARNPLLRDILPTYTGNFPKALGHVMHRGAIDEWIVIYCSDGRGWYETQGRRFLVEEGDVLFCFKGQAHGYGADDLKPWTIHWAHFIGEQVPNYLKLIGASKNAPVVQVGQRLRLIALFRDMIDTLEAGYSLQHLLQAASGFRQILSSMALARMYSKPEEVGDLNVEGVITFMREALHGFLSLGEIAGQAHMSPSHFSRKFKAKTGYAPVEYFHRLKMQRACELLDTTHHSVGEVGDQLGYEDPYYFSRIFKKLVGRSPRTYRKMRSDR